MASSIIASVITGGTNSHQTVAEELNAYATDFVSQGVVGTITSGTPGTGAFAVTQDSSPDMGVTVLLGVAYVSGTPSGQDPQVIRARMTSNYTGFTITSNSSGSTKYDWIYLQLNATNASTPDSAADNVINLYTSRSSSNSADNGSPPTYGLLLAVVTVANGASSITNANIADKRQQVTFSSGDSSPLTTGWNPLNYALTYSANNGNKEFQVTTPNNLGGLLSAGMKLSVARSVSPPTQCMAFASASSQYASKTSPTGITFTSAFTCEAWIYLQSYGGANNQAIISRFDGTHGFILSLSTTGQVAATANGSSTSATTYQSIPLNSWIHVAGTFSAGTFVIYINGMSVPFSQSGSATSITQAGALQVGAYNSTNFFNGYISEARVWSVAQSQANIQANMAISISGAASNLVAYFQGAGNFTDATSNANTLTASGGAIATQTANPYNATEYAFITVVSYSAPTTTLTLKAVGGTVPNITLNTPQYSTVDTPYGWPSVSGSIISHRLLELPFLATQTTTATSSASFGGSSSSTYWPFTVPSNCGKIKVIVQVNNLVSGSSTNSQLYAYNGTTNILSLQQTTANASLYTSALVPVVPGSTINFNLGFATGTGTVTWASSGGSEQGVMVEAA
jgi:hypothetical protein